MPLVAGRVSSTGTPLKAFLCLPPFLGTSAISEAQALILPAPSPVVMEVMCGWGEQQTPPTFQPPQTQQRSGVEAVEAMDSSATLAQADTFTTCHTCLEKCGRFPGRLCRGCNLRLTAAESMHAVAGWQRRHHLPSHMLL